MEYQIESWIDGGSMVILFCWWSKTPGNSVFFSNLSL